MKMSKLTLIRLVASGALLGVVVAGAFGIDLSGSPVHGLLSGFLGAGSATIALKLVHLI